MARAAGLQTSGGRGEATVILRLLATWQVGRPVAERPIQIGRGLLQDHSAGVCLAGLMLRLQLATLQSAGAHAGRNALFTGAEARERQRG